MPSTAKAPMFHLRPSDTHANMYCVSSRERFGLCNTITNSASLAMQINQWGGKTDMRQTGDLQVERTLFSNWSFSSPVYDMYSFQHFNSQSPNMTCPVQSGMQFIISSWAQQPSLPSRPALSVLFRSPQ